MNNTVTLIKSVNASIHSMHPGQGHIRLMSRESMIPLTDLGPETIGAMDMSCNYEEVPIHLFRCSRMTDAGDIETKETYVAVSNECLDELGLFHDVVYEQERVIHHLRAELNKSRYDYRGVALKANNYEACAIRLQDLHMSLWERVKFLFRGC